MTIYNNDHYDHSAFSNSEVLIDSKLTSILSKVCDIESRMDDDSTDEDIVGFKLTLHQCGVRLSELDIYRDDQYEEYTEICDFAKLTFDDICDRLSIPKTPGLYIPFIEPEASMN